MYGTRTRKVKTDRRDARALAEACLLGAYHPAHRLTDPQRHVRGRLGVRDALVRTRTRYLSLICALLRQHGYRVPSGSAEHFIQRVQRLPLPGRLLSVVAPLLAVMRPLNQQLTYSDATIEHLAVQDPRVPRLRSVPCIGCGIGSWGAMSENGSLRQGLPAPREALQRANVAYALNCDRNPRCSRHTSDDQGDGPSAGLTERRQWQRS